MYNNGKSQSTISLNSNYSVIFRNGRDESQFRSMSYQICPNNGKWFFDSFTNAPSKPYGYLILDHHLSTPKDHMVFTNILPKEQLTYYINSYAKGRRHYNFLMYYSQSKLKRKSNRLKVVKRTIKFRSIEPDLDVVKAVIKKATIAVIGAFSNGTLNCRQNAVHIPPHLIPFVQRHNQNFDYLVDSKNSIPSKRLLILQKSGSLLIIASLLSTVLGSIKREMISRLIRKNDE